MSISNNELRRLRKQKNMTIQELSQKTGINYRLIQKYESGKVNPKTDNLTKIARVLGIEIEDLISPESLTIKDIDVKNSHSINQLLFQLEEKRLFCVENTVPKLTYQNNQPQWTLEIPIDKKTAIFFQTWAQLKQAPLPINKPAYEKVKLRSTERFPNNQSELLELQQWKKIDLEHWKYDEYAQQEINSPQDNINLKTTKELLNLDLLTPEESITRIRMGFYEHDDLERIFHKMNATNYPANNTQNEVYQLFLDQVLPEKFILECFEKKGPYGLPKFNRGYVRELYDKAKKELSVNK